MLSRTRYGSCERSDSRGISPDSSPIRSDKIVTGTIRLRRGRSFLDQALQIVDELRLRFLSLQEEALRHPEEPEKLHQMRIAGKPLRYLMESLEGSYGKEFKRSLRELEETLDLLGSIHDCDVAIATLTQYREELSIANARGGEKAAGVPSRPVTGLLLSQQAARNRLMRQLHRTLRLRESS